MSDPIIAGNSVIGIQPSRSGALARTTRQYGEPHFGQDVEIRAFCEIFAGVSIADGTLIGSYVSIFENCRIGRNCVIGRGVSLGHDVIVQDNVRIMDNAFLTGGTFVGEGTFIAQGVLTANDDRPEEYKPVPLDPPMIGKKCLIGMGAIIRAGVKIGDGAVIAAGAVVVDDVPPGAMVKGVPGRVSYRTIEQLREHVRAAGMPPPWPAKPADDGYVQLAAGWAKAAVG